MWFQRTLTKHCQQTFAKRETEKKSLFAYSEWLCQIFDPFYLIQHSSTWKERLGTHMRSQQNPLQDCGEPQISTSFAQQKLTEILIVGCCSIMKMQAVVLGNLKLKKLVVKHFFFAVWVYPSLAHYSESVLVSPWFGDALLPRKIFVVTSVYFFQNSCLVAGVRVMCASTSNVYLFSHLKFDTCFLRQRSKKRFACDSKEHSQSTVSKLLQKERLFVFFINRGPLVGRERKKVFLRTTSDSVKFVTLFIWFITLPRERAAGNAHAIPTKSFAGLWRTSNKYKLCPTKIDRNSHSRML